MKKIITCLLVTLELTTACGQKNYENMEVKEFAELITDSSIVILDVRTADEYTDGHIKRAILIDQYQSDFMEQAKAVIERGQSQACLSYAEAKPEIG